MALDQAKFDRLKGLLSQADAPSLTPQKPGFIGGVAEAFNTRADNVADIYGSQQNTGSKVLQNVGQGFGLLGDVGAEAVKAVVPDAIGAKGVEAVEAIADTAPVESFIQSYNTWKEANPEQAANFEAVVNIGSVLPVGGGLGLAGNGVKTAATVTADAAKAAAKSAIPTAIKDTAKGGANALTLAAESLGRIPARISTNVAEKSAQREAINALPSPVARQAANDGIDLGDVQYVSSIAKEQKKPISQLFNAARDFADGKSKLDPKEVVGRPIIERIKTLDKEAGKVGQKLGKAADNLGKLTVQELGPPIYSQLKKVPGLAGLKISKAGKLDFTDTVLQTAATKSDRIAIQKIFNDAIKPGAGKRKHLLRQELFEVLDGKKKSLTNLTGTQEKAYQAIRQGLSDALDLKNDTYKLLNKEYATIARPLSDIRKFLKDNGGLDEDILSMKAGTLARRLTSNAPSGADLRQLLRTLDKATKKPGKAQLSIESLQDAYNIIEKYFDITGKTSLKGQVTSGIEAASGVKDALVKFVGDVAGKSEAVRRKAFEALMEEALK